MSKDIREVFLQLVRLGIGHIDSTDCTEIFDWTALKTLAEKQGLSAVVLDGVDKLRVKSGELRVNLQEKILLAEWIGEVHQFYEQRYKQYLQAISSLAKFYNSHGFKMMILKGYACSLDWPKPEHRPCGDIDIWLFGQQKKADAALEAYFKDLSATACSPSVQEFKIDSSHHHHTVFNWQGFMVENHYDFINVYHRKSGPKLEAVLKELGADDSHSVELYGEKVYLPSTALHALFLLYHTMLHFTSTEMSIRQLLDWGLFVKKHTKEIDWEWFMSLVEEFHLKEFFNIINAICVEDLGFDACIFNGVQFSPYLKDRVLRDTLSPEFTEEEPKWLLKRFFFRYRRWKSHEWKHNLCFEECMWSIFWTAVWSHILKPGSI